MPDVLNGKVAVVIGGSGGIGAATCVRLAEADARVVVGGSQDDVNIGQSFRAA